MTTRGQGGPQRNTRAHPILFSEGEEDTVEAQVGDWELAVAGAPEEAVTDLFHVVSVQEPETEPVVRPKTGKVSTPRDGAESVPVGQDFLLEMQQFMKQQQRNENILFDELKGLKATIFQKPQTVWGSVDSSPSLTNTQNISAVIRGRNIASRNSSGSNSRSIYVTTTCSILQTPS